MNAAAKKAILKEKKREKEKDVHVAKKNTDIKGAVKTKDKIIPAATPAKFYSIQVKSCETKQDAERLVSFLKKKGYTAYLTTYNDSKNKRWFRVRIGSFEDVNMAHREAQIIKDKEKLAC